MLGQNARERIGDHQTDKLEAVSEAAEHCLFHSSQSEAAIHSALWPLPQPIIEFVRDRVSICWKQRNRVAVLLPKGTSERPYTIILDTKLENESMKVRVGIMSLKLAEAYLLENPSLKATREELATQWGVDLIVLENDSIWGLTY